MATNTVTLTGNVRDIIDAEFDPRRAKVFIQHNTPFVADPDEGVIRLGSASVSPAADGSFSLPDVIASVDTVENLQATVWVDYPDALTRKHKRQSFGPYDLSGESGSVDLTELEETQHLDASYVSVTMAAMQALLDAQIDISGISTSDGVVEALVKNTGGAGPLTSAALSASYVGRSTTKASGTGRTVAYEVADPNLTASKWREVYGSADFSGHKDPVRFFGWNADKGLGGGDTAEPAFYMGMEADYHVSSWNGDGTAHRVMEWYVNYNSPDNSTVTNFRPFAFSLGADDNSSHWATVQVDIGTDTAYRSLFNVIAGGSKNLFHLDGTSGAVYVPLTVSGAYGANGVIFDSSSTGNVYAGFGDGGTLEFQLIRYHGDGKLYLWDASNSRSHMEFTRGSTNATALTEFQSQAIVHQLLTSEGGLLLQGGTGYANTTANVTFATGASQKWQHNLYQGDTALYVWDLINSRYHVKHNSGSTPATSSTEFNGQITVHEQITSEGGVFLQGGTGYANTTAHATFATGGTQRWGHFLYQGDTNFYTWDVVNGRFQVKYTAGASNTAATTEFQSNVKIDGGLNVAQKTPSSASATGTTGDIAADANYVYVCTATNTWKRVAVATW